MYGTLEGHKVMTSMPTNISSFIISSIRTIPYLAAIIGPLIFCSGLWISYATASFQRSTLEVDALVVTVEERQGKKGVLYRPHFEVEASDGTRIQYAGNIWVAPKPHEAGATVAARYDPSSGAIRSKTMLQSRQALGSVLLTTGGILTVLGAAFFGLRRQLRRKRA